MIRRLAILSVLTALPAGAASGDVAALPVAQAAIVKVYGVGGVAGLEGYQTGVFVEESGALVTVDSTVLETGSVTLVDAYGDRYEGRVVGRDAATGLALLACPESVTPPGVLPINSARETQRGESAWALSNAFAIAAGDEPVTAQRGRVAAIGPMPGVAAAESARAPIGSPRSGSVVLMLDAVTSNPGAGGGALVGGDGRLLGVLGAECRSPLTGAWINYAVPAAAVGEALTRIRSGESEGLAKRGDRHALARARLRETGIVLIPAVTRRTPPFVEHVVRGSAADRAGVLPDDLIVAVDDTPIGLGEAAAAAIVDRQAVGPLELTILRDQQVFVLTLQRVAP